MNGALAYVVLMSVAALFLSSYTIIKEYRPSVPDVSALQLTAVSIAFHLVWKKYGYSPSRRTKMLGFSTFYCSWYTIISIENKIILIFKQNIYYVEKIQWKYFQERTLYSEQILQGFVVQVPTVKYLCKDWMTQYLAYTTCVRIGWRNT